MTDAFQSAAGFLRSDLFRRGDRQAQRIGLAAYRLLARGRPVSTQEIARAAGADAEMVRAAVDATSRAAAEWDDQGRIVGYAGLTLLPTRHRITVDGQTLYTWCAFDSLFVPEILAKAVRVASACPSTGAEIRLAIAPDRLDRVEPQTAVVSFVTPDKARCEADIRGAFCQHVNFFSTSEAATAWQSDHGDASVFTMEQAFELAALRNRVAFGEALAA